MKIEKIMINSAYVNQEDITSCHDATRQYKLRTTTVTALIIFDDKTKPSITVTIEVPGGEYWELYIKSLLSNIQF